ncbi:FRG domain-containing protein [Stenotrophomonas maltophilia]|uniref:FRG domain-containing protein n=1 Tax=Stenotrophomonas maltophilia TaxID=40324 RepID=UPI0021C74E85|nr:FRG domain-containing protein [Stenotrophomonas maltophilia]MCU1030199.1 FRG domain-containing protein [Stenotrophomonas maltophilia]
MEDNKEVEAVQHGEQAPPAADAARVEADDGSVKSLPQYVDMLDRLLNVARERNPNVKAFQNWYRGVSSHKHQLVPAVYRLSGENDSIGLLNIEASMMQDFERHAILRVGSQADGEDARSPIMKLFHMQHYGIPTRLLDWSTNPFIALYFALSGRLEDGANPAVWVLDPWGWNREVFKGKTWKDRGPAHVADPAVEGYYPRESYDARDLRLMDPDPVAVVGVYNTERMRAQRGVFTFFGKEVDPMEDVLRAKKMNDGILTKIEINREKAPEIFERLLLMGYTDSVSYPDFHGVALEIRRTYGYPL